MTIVLKTDETGALVLPADVLGDAKPGARYVVEAREKSLVIHPETPQKSGENISATPEEWLEKWSNLSKQVTAVWNSDKSATEIISEMRR